MGITGTPVIRFSPIALRQRLASRPVERVVGSERPRVPHSDAAQIGIANQTKCDRRAPAAPSQSRIPLVAAIFPEAALAAADMVERLDGLDAGDVFGILVPDLALDPQPQRFADLALKYHLPSVFAERAYVEAGGLMSLGESLKDFYRRAASFVDKIFKGARPGDLPIEQLSLLDLVINRKTAQALGVGLPPRTDVAAYDVID